MLGMHAVLILVYKFAIGDVSRGLVSKFNSKNVPDTFFIGHNYSFSIGKNSCLKIRFIE